jgi:hypothetical protein
VQANIRYFMVFAVICCVVGVVAKYLFGMSLWVAIGLAASSLLLNGLVGEWEDRKKNK